MSEVYTWEPSNEAIAARYGLPVASGSCASIPTPPPRRPASCRRCWRRRRRSTSTPSSAYQALTDAAAAYAGVPPDEVIVGAGADEILDLVGKAFLPTGGAAVVPGPSYGMPVITSQRDARRIDVPRRLDGRRWTLDVDGVVDTLVDADVVWLCEPNNPTGSSDEPEALRAVLEAAAMVRPPLVAVDEAYFEFTGRTVMPGGRATQHLVVVRTLSKAFGLAGIRVGWAVAARPTIARLEHVRPPGSISTVSAALAAEALRCRPAEARGAPQPRWPPSATGWRLAWPPPLERPTPA